MGWKPYWAVLERGILSLFGNRADASIGHKRKSFRYLDDAKVVVIFEELSFLSTKLFKNLLDEVVVNLGCLLFSLRRT